MKNILHVRQCTKCKQFTLTDTHCLFCGEKDHILINTVDVVQEGRE